MKTPLSADDLVPVYLELEEAQYTRETTLSNRRWRMNKARSPVPTGAAVCKSFAHHTEREANRVLIF